MADNDIPIEELSSQVSFTDEELAALEEDPADDALASEDEEDPEGEEGQEGEDPEEEEEDGEDEDAPEDGEGEEGEEEGKQTEKDEGKGKDTNDGVRLRHGDQAPDGGKC